MNKMLIKKRNKILIQTNSQIKGGRYDKYEITMISKIFLMYFIFTLFEVL